MTKYLKVFLLTISLCVFVAGSSMAFSITYDKNPGTEVNLVTVDASTAMDYWTLTDLTSANSYFQLKLEYASYESDFGLYTVDDIVNPTEILNTLTVFSKNDEPYGDHDEQSVWFKKDDTGNWLATNDNENDDSWISFGIQFGFYFGVYTGGADDKTLDYKWYSDKQFNSDANGKAMDTDIEHIATFIPEDTRVRIFLDDQKGGGDRDFTDMIVFGNDLQPAPVPEPATMLLFGMGLLGLAGVARKKNS